MGSTRDPKALEGNMQLFLGGKIGLRESVMLTLVPLGHPVTRKIYFPMILKNWKGIAAKIPALAHARLLGVAAALCSKGEVASAKAELSKKAETIMGGKQALAQSLEQANLYGLDEERCALTYRKYEEVREKPTVRFNKKQRVRSEAISRKLADEIVDSMRDTGLPVQPYQPVRNRIIRGKQRWVPAVLRGNEIPTKVLFEMLNLSNREDARLLGSARTREEIARALQLALFRHFGETPSPRATTTAAQ